MDIAERSKSGADNEGDVPTAVVMDAVGVGVLSGVAGATELKGDGESMSPGPVCVCVCVCVLNGEEGNFNTKSTTKSTCMYSTVSVYTNCS